MNTVIGRVLGVCAGPVQSLRAGGRVHQTGFVKAPILGRARVGTLGIEGDEHIYHAHGGPDQALLVYSHDHYSFWRTEHHLDLPDVGAMAENLTVEGLTESQVCIGDTFHIGEVVAQITSPRTPCYKIGLRYGDRDLPVVMQDLSNSGYLMRVITGGTVGAGDSMVLTDRPADTMTVAEAARVVARDRDDWDTIERLAALPGLAEAMRAKLRGLLQGRVVENEDARLFGEGEGDRDDRPDTPPPPRPDAENQQL